MPMPSTQWVDCDCERCGFKGQRAADIPHTCLVMVNLDQYERIKAEAVSWQARAQSLEALLGKIHEISARARKKGGAYQAAKLIHTETRHYLKRTITTTAGVFPGTTCEGMRNIETSLPDIEGDGCR